MVDAHVRIPMHPKTLAEKWAGKAMKPGQTLVEIYALEDEPGRACGRQKCGRYVDPLTMHVVDDRGQPWHMDCWYDTWERRPDGSWQMKMF